MHIAKAKEGLVIKTITDIVRIGLELRKDHVL